jgi:hypothetical protein
MEISRALISRDFGETGGFVVARRLMSERYGMIVEVGCFVKIPGFEFLVGDCGVGGVQVKWAKAKEVIFQKEEERSLVLNLLLLLVQLLGIYQFSYADQGDSHTWLPHLADWKGDFDSCLH